MVRQACPESIEGRMLRQAQHERRLGQFSVVEPIFGYCYDDRSFTNEIPRYAEPSAPQTLD